MLNNEALINHERNNQVLVDSVIRQDIFADNTTDEFRITREDGKQQGIFKVWAAPVIAQLEGMDSTTWADELRNKPLSLFECLETWRAISVRSDHDLQEIFNNNVLPASPESAVAELFARLTTAFAVSAPFYQIEAMVADNRIDRHDNPIDFSGEAIMGGKLDAVALLLPSAVKSILIAKQGDWGGLNWERIRSVVSSLDDAHSSGQPLNGAIMNVLRKVASLASLDVETVVFAANALEFIPWQVGGKATDFSQDKAIELLNRVLDEPMSNATTTRIAKDMNAMIRFLNWTPSIRSDANFSGKNWMYDSVCATAAELLGLVSDNIDLFFDDDFGDFFKNNLIPQLEGIDATSAKGRVMLQLLHEGKFNTRTSELIAASIEKRVPELLAELDDRRKRIDFDDFSVVSQVGGKAVGLRMAIELFGEQAVVSSKVIPVNAVNEWLIAIPGLQLLLRKLELDPECRADTAEQIRHQIIIAEPPHEMLKSFARSIDSEGKSRLAFRSSSFDEDVDVIGPAPGIYDSALNIDPSSSESIANGFKTVVSSFFTAKAVHFREAKGLRHKPIMAVLGQRMINGPGGSVFIQDGQRIVNIAASPSMINDHNRANEVHRIILSAHGEMEPGQSSIVELDTLAQLSSFAGVAYSVLGPVDMEFVCDPTSGELKILQLRRLERPVQTMAKKKLGRTALFPVSKLSDIIDLEPGSHVTLVVNESDDVEKFQGELFKSIASISERIAGVRVPKILPPTCHFVNILMTMGIHVEFSGGADE